MKKSALFLIFFLLISCSQKKAETSEDFSEDENISLIFDGIYIPDLDRGDWVQQVVDFTEEEIAAAEIQELLEIESIIKSPYSVNANEVEYVEKRFADSNKRLKSMEYGAEIFVPVETSKNLIFINKYKENVVRCFYNSNYLLEKKEIWNMEVGGEEKKLLTQEYEYGNGNKPIHQKNIYEDKIIEYTWQYDDKGRITYEREIVEEKGKRNSKTQIYSFNSDDKIPANYEYYENDVLQVKTIYTTVNTYVTQVFFEDDFSVTTNYENGIKTKETYIQSGEIVREKLY